MHADALGHIGQGQGDQMARTLAEKGLLKIQDALGTGHEGAAPLLDGTHHPLGLPDLAAQVFLDLVLVALLHQTGIVTAAVQRGEKVVVGQKLKVIGKADHDDVGIDVGQILPGGKAGAGAGIQGSDQLAGLADFLRSRLQFPGDEAVAALGERLQLALGDLHRQGVYRRAPLQLETQTLG